MARARWWQKTALFRYYALAMAVTLVSLGPAGLTGVLNWKWQAGLYYMPVGLFFAYAGLFVRDREGVRQMVEGLGVLLVLVAVTVIAALLLIGQHRYWGPIGIIPLAVGITSILAARILRDVQAGEGSGKGDLLIRLLPAAFYPTAPWPLCEPTHTISI